MKRANFSGMVKAEANASHPLQHNLKFIFTDFEPNKNRQGVPKSEADNILATAMYMPVKVNYTGNRVRGHANAAPIGPITSVEYRDDYISGNAVIWRSENPDFIEYLKKASAEEGGVRFSWELYYRDSEFDDHGVEWLRGVVVGAITIVDDPAYGDRTPLLSFAETEQQDTLAMQIDDLKREHIITELALDIATKPSYVFAEVHDHELVLVDGGYAPPASVRDATRKGLMLFEQFGKGGTVNSVDRARNLVNGKSVSASDALRMAAYFSAFSEMPQMNDDDPSDRYVDWLLWGGDDAKAWSLSIAQQLRRMPVSDASGDIHMEDNVKDQTEQPEVAEVVEETPAEQPEATPDGANDEQTPADEQVTLPKAEYDQLTLELSELRKFKSDLEFAAARAELLEKRHTMLASAGITVSEDEYTAQSEFFASMDDAMFDKYVANVAALAKSLKVASAEKHDGKNSLVPDPMTGHAPVDVPVTQIVAQFREYKKSVR